MRERWQTKEDAARATAVKRLSLPAAYAAWLCFVTPSIARVGALN
jgi:hypothetical protein